MTFHRRLLQALSAIPPSYEALILAMAPSAYWRMNEAPGATTLADATGNGNTLTLSGYALPGATGITPNQSSRTSVEFLGTNQTLVANPLQGSAALASGSTWDSVAGTSFTFVGTVDMCVSGVNFPVGKANAANGWYFIQNGGTWQFVCAGQSYNVGTGSKVGPTHLAFSIDYTTTTNAINIWIDGALTTLNRTGAAVGLSQPTIKFFLGGRSDGFSQRGRMQACAYWFGTALNDAQVQALFRAHNRADRTLAPIPFIYDNDQGTTDVGDFISTGITMLYAMRNQISLIGAIATASDDYAAPCVRQQLNYYSMASVPVGAFQGSGIPSNPTGAAQKIRQQFAPLDVRANYPDAVTLYGTLLTAAANNSVVVFIGGSLASVAAFLNASTANVTLWNAKVRAVGLAAGQWPNSSSTASPVGNFLNTGSGEYNLATLPQTAIDFVTKVTVPCYWSGVEICGNVGNSPALGNFIATTSPAYYNLSSNVLAYPSGIARTSWDQIAVLQIIEQILRGTANQYVSWTQSTAPVIQGAGVNAGQLTSSAGAANHYYITPKLGSLSTAQWRTWMASFMSQELPPNSNTYT